jgi:hypothetical protein
MEVIDKILREWSFRCHDGIVDMNDPKKVAILNIILEENGIESSNLKDVNPNSETTPNTPEKELTEAEKFEKYIIQKYAVPGQGIIGLQNLYIAIDKDPQKTDLLNIIEKTSKTLTSGEISLNETDKKLFNLIMQYVKVSNGEPSELWFAILFGGQVEGGVKEKGKKQSDIVSDVKVGSSKVSLKNYTELNVLDFGSLPSKELTELKYLFTIFSIISEEKLTSSLTRNSINNLFTKITSEEFLKIFEEFIAVVKKHPNIAVLQRIYNRIEPLLKASKPDIENGEDIKEIVNNFIKKINELIKDKINKVDWWAIIKGGKKDIQNLYLLSSNETIRRITSTDNQLNSAITQFKGNGLYVDGNVLLGIPKPSSEKENLEEEIEEYI